MGKSVTFTYLTDDEWAASCAGGPGMSPILAAVKIKGGYVVMTCSTPPESPTSAASGEGKATASAGSPPPGPAGAHGGPRGRA